MIRYGKIWEIKNHLKCVNENCLNGKYFHLKCLGYKKRPNNYKTQWLCNGCIATKGQVSPKRAKLDEHDDSLTLTHVSYEADIDRHRCLSILNDEHYNIIEDVTGWLDTDIIDQAQFLIKQANPNISSLQRTCLGPCNNFEIVTGEFIQILHTGNSNWVCVSSIGCRPGKL